MGWRTAFLTQARSDFDMLRLFVPDHEDDEKFVKRYNIPECHKLHYLQMCAEKLAKGFLTDEETKPLTIHRALVRFIQAAKLHKGLMKACNYQNVNFFQKYLKSLIEIAETVEDLVPLGAAERLKPEYPWYDSLSNTIVIPAICNYGQRDRRLNFKDPKMMKLMNFIQACFQMIE